MSHLLRVIYSWINDYLDGPRELVRMIYGWIARDTQRRIDRAVSAYDDVICGPRITVDRGLEITTTIKRRIGGYKYIDIRTCKIEKSG